MTFPLYLKDLDVGQDLTFKTLLTKVLEKATVAENKEQRNNKRTFEVER